MNILNKTHPSNQIKMHIIQNNDQMVLIKNKPKIFDKCIKKNKLMPKTVMKKI